MATKATDSVITKRALCVTQDPNHPLFLFALTGEELLQIADVSKISRDEVGRLIGYQRPEVKRHIHEIVQYLDGDGVLFPNSIIIALSSNCRFTSSRGPKVSDGLASAGTLEIPLPGPTDPKPGWIVDGQQRAVALSKSNRKDLPVPVNAFLADGVDLQRDQFLRVNNTKPLPRGLVTELLPEVDVPISPRLSARKMPSALTDLLNQDERSPFRGLIRRTSTSTDNRNQAVVTDTSLVNMLQESIGSTSGCLFPFRNIASGETDFDGIWEVLIMYWSAVRDTFPDAWGLPPTQSRLMHGAGIRAMGRLMDKIMSSVDVARKSALDEVHADLQLLSPHCRWTNGTWESLGLRWNEIQNVPKHLRVLSNFLIRTYLQAKRS